MENIVEHSLLYDFYGELLSEHQRRIYEAYVSEDLSLSEIAEEYKISRQGVHDVIKRTNAALSEYEEKLRLLERFKKIKAKLKGIEEAQTLDDAKKCAEEISELL